jgi:hypothetical protein
MKKDTAETEKRPDEFLPYPLASLLDQQRLTLSALSFEAGLYRAFVCLFFNISPESGLL